eukprot:TRINITY_DN395_c0_g1_i12.p1 TRINITY_DN395_c0_g1~~TRINITY_DN395_c0_g1_i12.p1  ORF type:complete len:285 (+),score=15.44 TRINITY_DN395_c0_g1_i12:497-1351(+)
MGAPFDSFQGKSQQQTILRSLQVQVQSKFSMVLQMMFSGFNETLVCMLLTCLTHLKYLQYNIPHSQASKVLKEPHHSLAYLLSKYCRVRLNKKYQLSDWRIRPLPKDMLKYAREDTHYLLYLYDILRSKLMMLGKARMPSDNHHYLKKTFEESKAVSLIMYTKPELQDFAYYNLLAKFQEKHTKTETNSLKVLLKWRDYVARIEDKSRDFIATNYTLVHVAENIKDKAESAIKEVKLFGKYAHEIWEEVQAKITKQTSRSNLIQVHAPINNAWKQCVRMSHRII